MKYKKIISKWIEDIVIGLNLCPFAKVPFHNNDILINICESEISHKVFLAFEKEIQFLQRNPSVQTTLLVTPNFSRDFLDFNDFIFDLNQELEFKKVEHLFQIVAFHPDFTFKGQNFNDRVNYVNRSPFPLIHILRTQSITDLNLSPNDGEKINLQNEKTLNSLTHKQMDRVIKRLNKF